MIEAIGSTVPSVEHEAKVAPRTRQLPYSSPGSSARLGVARNRDYFAQTFATLCLGRQELQAGMLV